MLLCRYDRLKFGMSGRNMQKINHTIVSIVSFLHVAPKGVKEVCTRDSLHGNAPDSCNSV